METEQIGLGDAEEFPEDVQVPQEELEINPMRETAQDGFLKTTDNLKNVKVQRVL